MVPYLLIYLKEKNNKYMVEYHNKKIHFGSANSEDYLTYKDPVRRDKYLTKAKKMERWSTYIPNSLLSKLLVRQSFELEKKN